MERPTVAVLGAPRTGKTSLIYALGRGLGVDVACLPTSFFALGKGVTALERCLDDVVSARLDTRLVFLVFDVTASESFAAVVAKGAALQSPDRKIALVGTKADLMPTDHGAVLVASEARIYASSEFSLYAEVQLTADPPARGLDDLLSLLRTAVPVKKPPMRKDIWLYDPYDDNAPPRSPTRAMNEIYLCGRAKALATERALSAKYEHKRYASPKGNRCVAPPPAPLPRPTRRRRSTDRHSTLMSSTQASVARVEAIKAYKPQREVVDPKIRVQWHRPRSPIDAQDEVLVPVRRVETRCAARPRLPIADAIEASSHDPVTTRPSELMMVDTWNLLDAPTLRTAADGCEVVPLADHDATRGGGSSQPDAEGPALIEVAGNADKTCTVMASDVEDSVPEPSMTQPVDADATFFDFDEDDAAVTFDDDDILDALDSFQLSI